MDRVPAKTVVGAVLFALIWHGVIGVIFIIGRDRLHDQPLWLFIVLALASTFFPVYVAVIMGYQEGIKRTRMPASPPEPIEDPIRGDRSSHHSSPDCQPDPGTETRVTAIRPQAEKRD